MLYALYDDMHFLIIIITFVLWYTHTHARAGTHTVTMTWLHFAYGELVKLLNVCVGRHTYTQILAAKRCTTTTHGHHSHYRSVTQLWYVKCPLIMNYAMLVSDTVLCVVSKNVTHRNVHKKYWYRQLLVTGFYWQLIYNWLSVLLEFPERPKAYWRKCIFLAVIFITWYR